MNTLISIIIPIYNVEQYIFDCLTSVVNQSHSDCLEVILVDDCGYDNSIHIAEEFIHNYKGNIIFNFIHHDKNRGLSEARNSGIRAAKGKYVFFLDSDDEIMSNCISSFVALLDKYPNVELIQGSYTKKPKYMKNTEYSIPHYTEDPIVIKKMMLNYYIIPVMAQNRLIKKDFLLQHNLFFRPGIIHEDNYWLFFLAKYVKKFGYCYEKTYFHRINPNSITQNRVREKEYYSYKTIIEECSSKIDDKQPGIQKSFLFWTLIHTINNNYFIKEENRTYLIKTFVKHNNYIESIIINAYFNSNNNNTKKILYKFLTICYKFDDLFQHK